MEFCGWLWSMANKSGQVFARCNLRKVEIEKVSKLEEHAPRPPLGTRKVHATHKKTPPLLEVWLWACLGTLENIFLIWACRTMLVQKIDEVWFLIDTFALKISMKTYCCDDDHLPYAYVYICIETSTNVSTGKPCILMYVRAYLHCRARSSFTIMYWVMEWSRQFFCLVCQIAWISISGAFESISGHNFYMGMQNGSKLSLLSLSFYSLL